MVWLRRLLILLFVLFWMALVLTPTMAFYLSRNGQIQVGRTEGRHWRVFLIQQADTEGLGLEQSRPVAAPADATGDISCLKTTIKYWMWAGEGQSAAFCQCADVATAEIVDVMPPACLVP